MERKSLERSREGGRRGDMWQPGQCKNGSKMISAILREGNSSKTEQSAYDSGQKTCSSSIRWDGDLCSLENFGTSGLYLGMSAL